MTVIVMAALMARDIRMAMEVMAAMEAMSAMDVAMEAKTMVATIEAVAVLKWRRSLQKYNKTK